VRICVYVCVYSHAYVYLCIRYKNVLFPACLLAIFTIHMLRIPKTMNKCDSFDCLKSVGWALNTLSWFPVVCLEVLHVTGELRCALYVLSGMAQPINKSIKKKKNSCNLEVVITNWSAKGIRRYITLLIKDPNHFCGVGLLGHATVFY